MAGVASELVKWPVHEHSSAWPHDDTHHLVAAFALLLCERGATTAEQLSARLTQVQVVRGPIDPDSLAGLMRDLIGDGLVAARETTGRGVHYQVTPAGRAVVDDWVAIMRDRRHLVRSFLALYDRSDE